MLTSSQIFTKPFPNFLPMIMGFPVAYTNLFIPNLIIQTLTLLISIYTTIFKHLHQPNLSSQPDPLIQSQSLSAILLRELLPVVKFSDVEDSCVVCLSEFDACDEIRGMTNCKHVFHRWCIDQWIEHGRKNCPVCRTVFVHQDYLVDNSLNEDLWMASGIHDYYADFRFLDH